MASLRDIRRRLRSIHNTQQIMRAMQLVSASKLKRSQVKLLQVRSVMDFLDGLLERVLASSSSPRTPGENRKGSRGGAGALLEHPLCANREGTESALVVFTSDTGLCGSYNTNLIQLAESHLRRDSLKTTRVIYVGRKGHRVLTKRGYPADEAFLDLAGRPNLEKANAIGRLLMERFLAGRFSSVNILYSQFVTMMTNRPTIRQWLPVRLSEHSLQGERPNAPTRQRANAFEYILEPSPQNVLDDLLPRWALATFTLILLESFTSEHSARMVAMKNATDNAGEIVEQLTMQRNKVRQATITREISEIVGTVEALR